MKVDPNAPAYPCHDYQQMNGRGGIPIRLAIAAQIMAQMVKDRNTSVPNSFFAGIALKWADALIAAHNEGSK